MAESTGGSSETLHLDDFARRISDESPDDNPVADGETERLAADNKDVPRSRGRRSRRWLLVALVAVVLAGLGVGWWLWHRSRTPAATTTTITYTVAPTTLQQSVTTTGTFAPATQDNLNFPASGTVTAVKAKVGQKVTKGQVLATEDTSALQAAVTSAQATVNAASSNLATLQASSTATSVQLSSAQATFASDQAKLSQAQQNLTGATMTSPITGTVAQVNLTAGTSVSGANSTTGSGSSAGGSGSGSGGSFSGAGSTGSGSSSSSSAQIVVVDTSHWIVNATVAAADLPSLKSGLQATMNLSAATSSSSGTRAGGFGGGGFGGGGFGAGGLTGGGLTGGGTTGSGRTQTGGSSTTTTTTTAAQQLVFGTVQSISQISSSTSGTAAFPVTIEVTGTAKNVYIGSTASVSILVKQLANAMAVPTAAISESNGTPTVQVQVNGQTQARRVTLGQVFGAQTQITHGLASGDVVVVGTRTGGAGGRGTYGGSGQGGTRSGSGTSGTSGTATTGGK